MLDIVGLIVKVTFELRLEGDWGLALQMSGGRFLYAEAPASAKSGIALCWSF